MTLCHSTRLFLCFTGIFFILSFCLYFFLLIWFARALVSISGFFSLSLSIFMGTLQFIGGGCSMFKTVFPISPHPKTVYDTHSPEAFSLSLIRSLSLFFILYHIDAMLLPFWNCYCCVLRCFLSVVNGAITLDTWHGRYTYISNLYNTL